jgi:hypothetical protein
MEFNMSWLKAQIILQSNPKYNELVPLLFPIDTLLDFPNINLILEVKGKLKHTSPHPPKE